MTSNVSKIREVDEGMLVTLLLLMPEVQGRPWGGVPREALEIVRVGAEVGMGAVVETEEKKVAKRRMIKRQTSMPDINVDGGKGGNARCNRCGEVGLKTVRCSGQMCSVRGGKGHSAKICANVVTVFACEADASGNDSYGVLSRKEQDAFSCDAPGKCFDEPGKWGTDALAWQMGDLPVICDNGTSCHMSHSSTAMINYHREANATTRTASRKRYPIQGYGDLPLTFRSSGGEVPMLLCNVAHVPSLSYHLVSLRVAADNGHTYTGNKNGVTVKFKTGETLFFPSVGRLNVLYAYRPGALIDENTNAVIAPGPEPSNQDTPVDINAFHAAHAHAHEGALRKTAKQMGVTLKGELHGCKGCSMAKGIRVPIPSKTHGRAAKRLFRVFVDLGGGRNTWRLWG